MTQLWYITFKNILTVQSPALATHHPRTAGEQATTAPARLAPPCAKKWKHHVTEATWGQGHVMEGRSIVAFAPDTNWNAALWLGALAWMKPRRQNQPFALYGKWAFAFHCSVLVWEPRHHTNCEPLWTGHRPRHWGDGCAGQSLAWWERWARESAIEQPLGRGLVLGIQPRQTMPAASSRVIDSVYDTKS